MENLGRQKQYISEVLRHELSFLETDSIQQSVWQKDGTLRVLDYTCRGKMIRGALVDLGYRLISAEEDLYLEKVPSIRRVAAAMELFQSMLLIHDDVMDQDELRRGKPSVHVQYRNMVREQGCRTPEHLGESMAICLGDVCTFQAFEMLASCGCDAAKTMTLVRFFSRELAYVGFAQMEDVHNSCSPKALPSDGIIQVYRFKTGRYTFSLPLMAGAIIADAPDSVLQELAVLGELMGIIFQIRDDHIGLFGKEEATGKPRGSDIRENKKTLHRAYLLESMDISDQDLIDRTFGAESSTLSDLDAVLVLMEKRGVLSRIDHEVAQYARSARSIMEKLGRWNPVAYNELEALFRYNMERSV